MGDYNINTVLFALNDNQRLMLTSVRYFVLFSQFAGLY